MASIDQIKPSFTARLGPGDLIIRGGSPVTSPARTIEGAVYVEDIYFEASGQLDVDNESSTNESADLKTKLSIQHKDTGLELTNFQETLLSTSVPDNGSKVYDISASSSRTYGGYITANYEAVLSVTADGSYDAIGSEKDITVNWYLAGRRQL